MNFDSIDEILTQGLEPTDNPNDIVTSKTPWTRQQTTLVALTPDNWVTSSVGFGYSATFATLAGTKH